MTWELTAFLIALLLLALLLKVVQMALHNVRCLEELTRINRHYRSKIKALEDDNTKLTVVNGQLRSRQQELLRENSELRRKAEDAQKTLAATERKLQAANCIIEQHNAKINRRAQA